MFLFARVTVQCPVQVNGYSSCPDISRENCRKRQRPADEDEPEEAGGSVQWKKKKRKKRSEKRAVLEGGSKQASDDDRKSQGKHVEEKEEKVERNKKKKKKERKKTTTEGNADIPKPAASTKKIQTSVEQPVKSSNKSTASQATTQNVSSSDSCSTLKIPQKSKPLTSVSPKGRIRNTSESWETQAASTAVPPHGKVVEPCNSDTEEESEPVNQPLTQQPGSDVGAQWSGRGHCRGKTRRGGPGERGRGRGHSGSFEFSNNKAKEPSYLTDSLTNTSMVFQVCLHLHTQATLQVHLYNVMSSNTYIHTWEWARGQCCHFLHPSLMLIALSYQASIQIQTGLQNQ